MKRVMIAGPQGDGMRALHRILAWFFKKSRKREVTDYIDLINADDRPGTLKHCFQRASEADEMIVILGRDPGRRVTKAEVAKVTEIDFLSVPEAPFTQMEVEAFVRAKSRANLYALIRNDVRALATGNRPACDKSGSSELEGSVALARVLIENSDKIYSLGNDLHKVLQYLDQHFSLGLDDLCQSFAAKLEFQGKVYDKIPYAPADSLYLSIVGHWSMLTSRQMEYLSKCLIRELAIIGPKPSWLTLPGLLQRIWVDAERCRLDKTPLAALAFPGDPPVRFVTFGHEAYLQIAESGEHLWKNEHLLGQCAMALADTFRQFARRCSSAQDEAGILLRQLISDELNFEKFSELNLDQLRLIHRELIDRSAEAGQNSKANRIDPNLHEFTEAHLKTVLDFLEKREISHGSRSMRHVVNLETIPTVPDMRFILTSACNLGCPYCPDGNEDFHRTSGPVRVLPVKALPIIAKAAEQCGVRTMAITGGEPTTFRGWTDALEAVTATSAILQFQIQTSGAGLAAGEGVPALVSMQSRLRIKLSIDPGHRQSRRVGEQALDTLLNLQFPKDHIEVNYVCDAEGFRSLEDYLKGFARRGVSAKLLDLLWYEDIGNRAKQSRYDFQTEYVEMERVREKLFQLDYKFVATLDKHFGVVEEVFQNGAGHQVRLRDSAKGTTYGNRCVTCDHYASGTCQEGIYQLEITSDLRCKICRHRPDLTLDLATAVGSESVDETKRLLQRAFAEFFSGVHRVRRFVAPTSQNPSSALTGIREKGAALPPNQSRQTE